MCIYGLNAFMGCVLGVCLCLCASECECLGGVLVVSFYCIGTRIPQQKDI